MPSAVFDIWSWRGRIGRRRYLITGLILFALKHNIDRLLATLYGYEWGPFNYLIFFSPHDSVAGLSPRNVTFYGVLVLFALPFIWIGVVLTLRRLRDADLPLWLVILFFIPLINLIFFVILAAIPSNMQTSRPTQVPSRIGRLIPESEFGSAVFGILTTALLTAVEIAFTTNGLGNVVTFSQLPAPTEAIFKTGIAYPIRAEIRGRGVGAVRHCIFSTGPFVEPITTWDEPRLLQFDVTEQPRAMEELSLYNDLRPPHVENYFVARKGQFALKPLPDGTTLLEGTTWYQNRFWPAPYWHLWSDYIIEGIHNRVLLHIKSLAENEPQKGTN